MESQLLVYTGTGPFLPQLVTSNWMSELFCCIIMKKLNLDCMEYVCSPLLGFSFDIDRAAVVE